MCWWGASPIGSEPLLWGASSAGGDWVEVRVFVGGSNGSRHPLQTDFKTADTDVNTDQDIEKNLVGTEALR